jgi:hypothetical protein
MDKKLSSSTVGGIIAGVVIVLGIVGYMVFGRGGGPEPLTQAQQLQEKVMDMTPEERQKFGQQYAAQMQQQQQQNGGAR